MKQIRLFVNRLALIGLLAGSTLIATPFSAQTTHSVWDGVFSAEQARRGEQLYQEACGECHGETLAGIDMAPGLAEGDFIWNYDGMPVAILFKRIRDTMPLGNPGALGRSEKADILAFILEQNRFPVGDTALSGRNSVLNAITWFAADPE